MTNSTSACLLWLAGIFQMWVMLCFCYATENLVEETRKSFSVQVRTEATVEGQETAQRENCVTERNVTTSCDIWGLDISATHTIEEVSTQASDEAQIDLETPQPRCQSRTMKSGMLSCLKCFLKWMYQTSRKFVLHIQYTCIEEGPVDYLWLQLTSDGNWWQYCTVWTDELKLETKKIFMRFTILDEK